MQGTIAWALDGIAVVAVLVCIYVASRQGFIVTVVRALGMLLSLLVAGLFAEEAAGLVFRHLLRGPLVQRVEAEVLTALESQAAQTVQAVVAGLPRLLRRLLTLGSGDRLAQIQPQATDTAAAIAETIVDQALAPILVALLHSILFFLLFSVCMFLVRRVSVLLRGINRLPIIGPLNAFLGAVSGVFLGIFYVYLGTLLLSILIAVTGGELTYLNRDILEESLLLARFSRYDPLQSLKLF